MYLLNLLRSMISSGSVSGAYHRGRRDIKRKIHAKKKTLETEKPDMKGTRKYPRIHAINGGEIPKA